MSGFIRFVVADRDARTGFRRGLIHAAERIRWEFSPEQEVRYAAAYDWLNAELPVPRGFAGNAQALSWYRDSAADCIACMREIAAVVEANDMPTAMLRTERPGKILYADAFQVVAEPFADTPC